MEEFLKEYREYLSGWMKNISIETNIYHALKFIEYIKQKDLDLFKNSLDEQIKDFSRNFKEQKIEIYLNNLKRFLKLKKNKNEQNGVILETALKEFLNEEKRRGLFDRTINIEKMLLNKLVRFLGENGISFVRQINENDLREYQKHLTVDEMPRPSHLYKQIGIMQKFFKFIYKSNFVYRDFSNILKKPKRVRYRAKGIFSRKDLKKFLDKLPMNKVFDYVRKTIYILLYSTGMRIGDLLNLKITDVDLSKKEICYFDNKTLTKITVPFGETAAGFLKVYLKYFRDKIKTSKSSDFLFCGAFNKKISYNSMKDNLKKDLKKSGLSGKNITLHSFRHTYARHLMENGCSIRYVAELLGHKNLTTTQIYTRPDKEEMNKVLRKFHPRENK